MMTFSLLAASVAFAVVCLSFALYTAADGDFRKKRCNNLTALFFGAVAMGAGMWSLHFLADIAKGSSYFDFTYQTSLLIFSMLVPVLSSYAALVAVSSQLPDAVRSYIGASAAALGICFTNFVATLATHRNAVITYDFTWLLLSSLFAMAASYAAFHLFVFGRRRRSGICIVPSALLLMMAIVGMQHLAMRGIEIVPATPGGEVSMGFTDKKAVQTIFLGLCGLLAGCGASYFLVRWAGERLQVLKEERGLYAQLFARHKHAMLIVHDDDAQTVLEWNKEAGKLLGKMNEQTRGAPLAHLAPVRGAGDSTGAEGGGAEVWMLSAADGTTRTIEARAELVRADGHAAYRVYWLREAADAASPMAPHEPSQPQDKLPHGQRPPAPPSAAAEELLPHLSQEPIPISPPPLSPSLSEEVPSSQPTLSPPLQPTLPATVDAYDVNRNYDDLFELYPGPVCCLDLEGRFLRVNGDFERHCGYCADELVGRSYELILWEEDFAEMRERFQNAAPGAPGAFAVRVRRKDGGEASLLAANFSVEGSCVFCIAVAEPNPDQEVVDVGGDDSPEAKITKREREVIALIAQGLSNKEIAARLSISENTVKNHVSNIFAKLGVGDRNQIPAMFPTLSD